MKRTKKMLSLLLAAIMVLCIVPMASAHSYSGDYRKWSQGGSDYQEVREVGCWIVAIAKLLYEANIDRSPSFNPDSFYNWERQNGLLVNPPYNLCQTNGGQAPVIYAQQKGKDLTYFGDNWDNSDGQIMWNTVNAGYYTIVEVGGHYVLIDNERTKATGQLYCYDSFYDRGEVNSQPLSRYSYRGKIYVYMANNPVNHAPVGCLDSATGGNGTITVKGWAYDPEASGDSIKVHVYIGGQAGNSNAESYAITANKEREDVNRVMGVSGKHGFSATIQTSKRGTQTVYVYGIDTQNGNNPLLDNSGKTVTISSSTPSCAHSYVCVVTKKATFTQDGVMTYKCSKCNYVRETKSIARINNVYLTKSSGVYNGKAHYPTFCISDSNNASLPSSCYSATIKDNVKIGTARVTITLKGNYSGTKYLDYSIVPGKPANLKSAAKSTSSLSLTWDKVPGATSYYVYRYDTGKGNYVLMGSVSCNGATINNVGDKTVTYAVAAVANNKVGATATVKGAAKPSAPQFTLTKGENKKVYLKWNAVPGATKYNVYYKVGNNGEFKKLATTSNLSITVNNFADGTTYYFRMLAYKTVDGNTIYSPYSQTKNVRF